LTDHMMLWAAATLCFQDFFRAGEFTVLTVHGFNLVVHLAWRDVSVAIVA